MGKLIKKHTVYFKPLDLYVEAQTGECLLEVERRAGVWVDALCGGNGTCGKCAVVVNTQESSDTYLACAYTITGDIEVDFPDISLKQTDQKILKDASSRRAQINPHAYLKLPGGKKPVLAAFDIGTTTLVGYLMDGSSGEELCAVSRLNPQAQYGADVISRTEYAMEHGAESMSVILRTAVNEMIKEAAEKACISVEDIALVTMVGNTCIHHLFLELPLKQLVTAPYAPAARNALELKAADYGIEINKNGKLLWLPVIGGFVGADTTAALLNIEIDKAENKLLMIDIGTNGEIALGDKYRYIVCSTAAGPALEGANISCGMRGADGAIDRVRFEDIGINLSVIGHKKPAGICGSGLIDAIAEMLRYGIIDESGRIADPEDESVSDVFRDRITADGGERSFVLVWESESGNKRRISITQRDIRELQLAKSAIAAGIRAALGALAIDFDDLHEIILAGAFGSYISPHSLCAIGVVPLKYENIIVQIGNAAGAGAKLAALNRHEFDRAKSIAKKAEYLELASDKNFQEYFLDGIEFPEQKSDNMEGNK